MNTAAWILFGFFLGVITICGVLMTMDTLLKLRAWSRGWKEGPRASH